jgi:hypothetical protein
MCFRVRRFDVADVREAADEEVIARLKASFRIVHQAEVVMTRDDHAIGARDADNRAVKGTSLNGGRDRIAWTASVFALCVLIVIVAACDRAPVTPVAPSAAAPPAPSLPRHTLSGTVVELIDGVPRPVGALTVWLWMEQQTSRGRMGSSQSVMTNQDGRYSLSVPDSRVFVSAAKQGAVQPCLATTEVRSDTTLDVELISETDTLLGKVPDRWLSAHPLVTGVVYEATAGGRLPLSGAAIYVDVLVDVYQAFTRTDRSGRFLLCRVNAPIRMDFDLPGYEGTSRSVRGDIDTTLEIALTRR